MRATRESRRAARPLLGVAAVCGVALVAFVGALIGLAAPAGAQYVPGQPGVIIDPPELPDTGGTANITGFGCPRNSLVEGFIVENGTEVFLGSATTDDVPEGSFSIPVVIPPETPGEYTILAKCGPFVLSTLLTITPSAIDGAAPVTGALPATGSDSTVLVQVGVLLIAVGGFAALAVRKRRTSHRR